MTAGGEGPDIYTAYEIADYSDITIEDFRRLDSIWDQLSYGIEFFQRPEINRHRARMTTQDNLISNRYCLTDSGEIYVIYSEDAENLILDLTDVSGNYDVRWYDPASGVKPRAGNLTFVSGGSRQSLGNPPFSASEWVVLVTKSN